MARMKVRRRRRAANPRGFIKYRGRLIASAPYFSSGRVVPKRRKRSGSRRRRTSSRRRRVMANPLFRSRRSGRYKSRAPGRRLHHYRRGQGWHLANNPPRRRSRRYSANPRHYSRRRYRSNPGRRRVSLLSNPMGAIESLVREAFSGDTIETAFHTGLGFGGALAGMKALTACFPALNTQWARTPAVLGAGLAGSLLLGMLGGKSMGVRAVTGTVLATLWQGVSEVVKGTAAAQWIPTLGEGPEAEAFRKAIEREVLKELQGGGGPQSTEEGMSYYLQPAGVSEAYLKPAGSAAYLQPAGSSAYLTMNESEAAQRGMGHGGMSAYLTSSEATAARAGMGDADAEFGGRDLPERF